MLGYSENEIEHNVSALLRLLHPDDKERSLQLVDAVMQGKAVYEIEFRLLHRDGHYLDILSRGYPVRRELDGKIVRIVGTHLDLTVQRATATGKPVLNDEFDIIWADGTVINFYGHATPLFDEQGQVRGTIGAFDDVTELKRAEEKTKQLVTDLDRQTAHLQAIIDVLPVGLWVVDATGNMVIINDNAQKCGVV